MVLLPPIGLREVAEGLYGATRLAQSDPHGIQFFGNTPEAFWKSFWAAAVALPAYILLITIDMSMTAVTASWLRIVLIEAVAYVVAWTAFPVAMHHLAEFIDRDDRYMRFIAAWNWAAVLQVMLYLFVNAFLALDILPRGGVVVVSLLTHGAIFVYQWWIARVGLDLGRGGAVGIVGLDFVISLTLSGIVRAML